MELKASNGHFENAQAGPGKTVTADIVLTGADAANYELTDDEATALADITRKELTGHITAQSKTYDGTDDAAVAPVALTGIVGPDKVALEASNGHFENAQAGLGKKVTASIAVTGADAGNYKLTLDTAETTADITRKELTGHITADDKDYDGNATATVHEVPLTGVVGSD